MLRDFYRRDIHKEVEKSKLVKNLTRYVLVPNKKGRRGDLAFLLPYIPEDPLSETEPADLHSTL